VRFGNGKRTGEIDEETDQHEVEVSKTINEFTFYYAYLTINNITAKKEENIPPAQRVLLCAIMAKPLDFCLTVDSKDNKLAIIAEELSEDGDIKSANSVYQSIKRLKDSGYLIQTEDKFIVVNARLQRVRYSVKKQLEKGEIATFDYIFKCYIKNDDDNNNEEEIDNTESDEAIIEE
jgi:hypothetical protein